MIICATTRLHNNFRNSITSRHALVTECTSVTELSLENKEVQPMQADIHLILINNLPFLFTQTLKKCCCRTVKSKTKNIKGQTQTNVICNRDLCKDDLCNCQRPPYSLHLLHCIASTPFTDQHSSSRDKYNSGCFPY